MKDHFFAGSFGGDVTKLGDSARLECGICWHVYDPAEGCEEWQIPPGTPFGALPAQWSCPVCDAPKEKFLLLEARDE